MWKTAPLTVCVREKLQGKGMWSSGLRCRQSQQDVGLQNTLQQTGRNNTPVARPAGCACLCACSSSAVAVARSWLGCCLTLSVLCRRLVRASSGLSSTMSSVVLGLPSSEDSALLYREGGKLMLCTCTTQLELSSQRPRYQPPDPSQIPPLHSSWPDTS